ncbi:hypothetical protein F5Y15DRAFT_406958 [Xylariaceae sp. FL0016]|nr:hypothetical protein F5Y15DRAFT_406958 [Xylariaceae sp. FL0016]
MVADIGVGKEANIAGKSPGVIGVQHSLQGYRAKLAQDLERRESSLQSAPPEKMRVSPIQEDLSSASSISSSDHQTASTESNKTVRGGITPGFAASTPSYPFPRMHTPGIVPSQLQRSLSQQSQTGMFSSAGAQFGGFTLQDQLRSDPSTPASAMTFLPPGAVVRAENFDYPTPNLYDLSLMLSAEPGLDAWWNTVVQIMTECFKAERITLSVPADATDIENVPWGQKATYNALEEDDFSMGYMARPNSSVFTTSADDIAPHTSDTSSRNNKSPRPGMRSRHSFTTYEEKKGSGQSRVGEIANPRLQRPGLTSRSKSHYPGMNKREAMPPLQSLNKEALEEHDAVADEQEPMSSWEATLESNKDIKGRVLPVLQALDLEADPLIDHGGINRVTERGKVIALTRTYPYLDTDIEESTQKSKNARSHPLQDAKTSRNQLKTDSTTKLSSLLANASAPRAKGKYSATTSEKTRVSDLYSIIHGGSPPRVPTPKFEEYEQAPPSPWSQSPAPSPAVRPDPNENPFFTDAMVDEESFNPGPSPHDYTASSIHAPETIGVENSWTVLHIPVYHPLLSKSTQYVHRFKLDSTVLENRSNPRGKTGSTTPKTPDQAPSADFIPKHRQPPMAILSILSPVIPYPSNLRYSLEYLAPHLATSFSLCRHYSNLETEVMGIPRKRPSAAGFGALGPDGRPLAHSDQLAHLSFTPFEENSQRSLTGSLTSPSDYSTQSHSITASPMGTPLWETGSLGLLAERRAAGASPGQVGGDSYFSQKPRVTSLSTEASSGTPNQRPRSGKQHMRSLSSRHHPEVASAPHQTEKTSPSPSATVPSHDDSSANTPKQPPVATVAKDTTETVPENNSTLDLDAVQSRLSRQTGTKHTKLHSYGGDPTATLQSLPPSVCLPSGMPLASRPAAHSSNSTTQIRPGSSSGTHRGVLPAPTDRLKGLMLDLLPVHIFVAMPIHGEIVWVNSRYQAYRGQTIADLVSDPWSSIHPEDRANFLNTWTNSLRTGEQFVFTVRLRRFDGAYRWHQARAVASRDRRGAVVQFIGSYMDIHEQMVAELTAVRQHEIEASEAKHRLLANLIPQIIFTATESEGVTFANEQWTSYTGQSEAGALGLGFTDFVHPDDLAKCRLPGVRNLAAFLAKKTGSEMPSDRSASTTAGGSSIQTPSSGRTTIAQSPRGTPMEPPGNYKSGHVSPYDLANRDLTELAKTGVVKISADSNRRLSITTELRLRSKSGEYRWHLIRCVEIDDVGFGSTNSSFFGSATDINDHKLLEAKLKEAMESKSRFLSNMSHEIRTPLIGISGMVSFLQDTTLNEEQRDYTNTIQTSANSLLMIINDILDLSKVDAGMMKLNFEWFHTRSLIEDVNELVSTMAIAKRLELNYVVEENVPSWVKGDKVRIRQVLLNVIGNAIKFTSEGEVFSRCRVYTDSAPELEENQIFLEYSVIDTGRGFTKEEAELIFKPFSQIDGSSTRQHGGSGLGLVISRQLVELHGGKMEGSAVPGKGSIFIFTAKFGLPTAADRPNVATSPPATVPPQTTTSDHKATQPTKSLLFQRTLDQPLTASPGSDPDIVSPVLTSSASSDPSVRSARTQNTARSSMSSVNVGLVHFSEAAKASGQDLSQMKLEMPPVRLSPQMVPTPDGPNPTAPLEQLRPPMYSILIICPQKYSRESTRKHIETTLPKDVPHQITAMETVSEAEELIGGHESVTFTHVVLNLASAEEIMAVIDQIMRSSAGRTTVLVLSDSVQRQAVVKLASDPDHQKLLAEKKVIFVYKPVKPSRFAVIFDPAHERDLSVDLNRFSAAQMVENQKQNYLDVEKRIGNKGYKVLLVEDNIVNQKVLARYLKKVGITADIAADGIEATEKVFAQPPGYYSLVLCDLHMPRKDGYQACREIREWERKARHPPLPIIALSANVMSDVQEKCVSAGFNDYVTKPVDFVDLSTAMSKYF